MIATHAERRGTVVGPDNLSIELIRDHLETTTVGYQMYLFWEVASTNATLRRLAEAGARDGTVVLAETQTRGRGRLGKTWFSPAGTNLHASVLFRPALAPRAVPVFSFLASLALTDAIRAEGVAVGVKWPNDVVANGRKVAGTLVSAVVAGDVAEWVIVGVGANVNVERATLDAGLGDLARDATSLREILGRPVGRNRFAARYLNALERWAGAYATEGPDAVLSAWRERDVLGGRRVEVRGEGAPYRGWVLGVDREGRLQVGETGGAPRAVVGGAIRVVD